MEHLPYIVSVIALLFSVYQFVKNSEKEDTTQITTVLIRLEAINNGVLEIKNDIKSMREDVQELRERVARVESSDKSAHHRIDRLEGKTE